MLTPGTVLSDNLLESRQNNFIAAVHPVGKDQVALAWLDLSTGEFFIGGAAATFLEDELRRIIEPDPANTTLEGKIRIQCPECGTTGSL